MDPTIPCKVERGIKIILSEEVNDWPSLCQESLDGKNIRSHADCLTYRIVALKKGSANVGTNQGYFGMSIVIILRNIITFLDYNAAVHIKISRGDSDNLDAHILVSRDNLHTAIRSWGYSVNIGNTISDCLGIFESQGTGRTETASHPSRRRKNQD